MISAILGTIGSGKTLLLTYFLWKLHGLGYTIYANYTLKGFPYVNVESINDFDDIKTKKNVFGIDELWMSLDSRRSQTWMSNLMSRHMLQSRKLTAGGEGSEDTDVYLTAQDFGNIDKRVRNITSYIFEPSIVGWRDKMPTVLEVRYYRLGVRGKPTTIYVPLLVGGVWIPECYERFQEMKEFEDDGGDLYGELMERYGNVVCKDSKLASYIEVKEKMAGRLVRPGDARRAADFISVLRANGEL